MAPSRKQPDQSSYSGRVANRMRKLRDKSGLTMAEFLESLESHGLDVGEPAYRHWENGTRKLPLDAVPSLAKTFGLSIAEFLPKR